MNGEIILSTVHNLKTGEEFHYTCSPKQALISTYALENNLMSQLACGNIGLDIAETNHFYTYGDLTVRKETE